MLPAGSSVTPGISLLPRVRGPIPDKNRKLPTRFACGNAPTGSGARELSKDSLMSQRMEERERRSEVAELRPDYIAERKSQKPRNVSPTVRELLMLPLPDRAAEHWRPGNEAAPARLPLPYRP